MSWASAVSRQATRFGASALPWYGWAAIAAGVAALLATRKASAAPPAPGATPAPKPPGPAPTLKKGSTGPWVSYLQSLLGIQQTANFDAATDTSVRAFQKSKGLGVDGVVGKQTWTALGIATAGGGATPKPSGGSAPSGGGGGGGGSPSTPPSGDTFSLPPSSPGGGGVLADDIAAREAQILAAVNAGNVDHKWSTLTWQKDGKTVSVKVSRRALALTGDWSSSAGNSTSRLIPNVTMPTAQKIADAFGAYLLTTKVSDEAYKQAALKLPVMSKNWQGGGTDNSGSKTHRMIDQSNSIESKVAGHQGLVANEGKDWVLTRRWWTEPAKAHNAANFGWYPGGSKSPGGASVVQSIGLAHDMGHTDYCVAPDTRVLTSDMIWRAAGDLVEGQAIVGFDEDVSRGDSCKYRDASVLRHETKFLECVEIETEYGTVVASVEHRWVTRTRRATPTDAAYARERQKRIGAKARGRFAAWGWTRSADLTVGDEIATMVRPWIVDSSHAGGWMAGILDGEGWCSPPTGVGVGQKPGMVLDAIMAKFRSDGFSLSESVGTAGVVRIMPTGRRAGMRALGMYRPMRLLPKARGLWENSSVFIGGHERDYSRVLAIRHVGVREVVAMQTTTKTLVCEGMLSHNSQLVRLMLPTVEIDGVPYSIAEVLADPARVSLLSDEVGAFPKPRHPDM